MPRFLDSLLLFGRALRRAGVDVHPGRMLDVVEALGHVNLARKEDVYHACRALLVHRPEQIPIFHRVFESFWSTTGHRAVGNDQPSDERGVDVTMAGIAGADTSEAGDASDEEQPIGRTWSDAGGVADKNFAECTPEELDTIRNAIARLTWTPGKRRTRRLVPGRGARIDIRRATAASRRTGGDIVRLPRRTRRRVPRPLVLLCDVSGSMERYSRMLLLFAHAMSRRLARTEAFVFSTRLTRVTHQLRLRRPDASLDAMSHSVADWSGGTRIGAAVKEFHHRWAGRALNGGAVVVIISDGWDRGEPEEVARQIARLRRSSYRLVWLNPLIGTVDYAPLTRGLVAALPFVDDFLPARTLSNFSDLATHLNALALSPGGRR